MRRYQRDRIKNKYRRHLGNRSYIYNDIEEWVNFHFECRTPCSCPSCGNPRKYLGELTRQEMKLLQSGLDDLYCLKRNLL